MTNNKLSNKETEVLRWVEEGKTNWEVSIILGISERTVKFHLSNIFKKYQVSNRIQAIIKNIELRS